MISKQTLILKAYVAFIFFVSMIGAAQSQEIVGSWTGNLSVQGTELPLAFNIKSEEGKLTATLDSPSQGATGIPMDEVFFVELFQSSWHILVTFFNIFVCYKITTTLGRRKLLSRLPVHWRFQFASIISWSQNCPHITADWPGADRGPTFFH